MANGIPAEGPSLKYLPDRQDTIHDLGSASVSTYRQAAADHFSQRSQVWLDTHELLGSSVSYAEAGHHFVEDQNGSCADGSLPRSAPKNWEFPGHTAHIACDGLHDHRSDFWAPASANALLHCSRLLYGRTVVSFAVLAVIPRRGGNP